MRRHISSIRCKKSLLSSLTNTKMECMVNKKLLQNPFIKNLAETENLTSDTAYRTSMGQTK